MQAPTPILVAQCVYLLYIFYNLIIYSLARPAGRSNGILFSRIGATKAMKRVPRVIAQSTITSMIILVGGG